MKNKIFLNLFMTVQSVEIRVNVSKMVDYNGSLESISGKLVMLKKICLELTETNFSTFTLNFSFIWWREGKAAFHFLKFSFVVSWINDKVWVKRIFCFQWKRTGRAVCGLDVGKWDKQVEKPPKSGKSNWNNGTRG